MHNMGGMGHNDEHDSEGSSVGMPGMMHEDGNTISVFSGKRKELTWKFGGDSEIVFACNVPGHFEAGMYHKASIMK